SSSPSAGASMPNVVVVGAQWGDEGKGKVVDLVAPCVDVVARYSGGPNAGHTIVTGGQRFVLQSLPSGVLRPGKKSVIGAGAVVDPTALLEEMEGLAARGIALDHVYVSHAAHVILPYHRALDRATDQSRIGTTGKGIGPAYADKAARLGVRVGDLLDEARLREKLGAALPIKNHVLRGLYGHAGCDGDGRAADADPRSARRDQGLRHASGGRPVPDGGHGRPRRADPGPGQGVRLGHGPPAAMRVVRCAAPPPRRAGQRTRHGGGDEARRARSMPSRPRRGGLPSPGLGPPRAAPRR